jgi:CoA binding domain/Pectate lyase superfamily protein
MSNKINRFASLWRRGLCRGNNASLGVMDNRSKGLARSSVALAPCFESLEARLLLSASVEPLIAIEPVQVDYSSFADSKAVINDNPAAHASASSMGVADITSYGAVGDGVTDDTAAIQLALDSGAATIYIPSGTYAIKATGTALTLSADDTTVTGPGTLVPIANASGWAPERFLSVTGDRNVISINIANDNDLGKRASEALKEYPMDAIRVTGSDNTISESGIWNFVTPIRITGSSVNNRVLNNEMTVKSVVNSAWANDGILFFFASGGEASGNTIGMATSAAQRTVQLTGVSGASTSDLRVGITLDAYADHILVSNNQVGEGFVVGIHAEGTLNEYNIISGNEVKKQNRNGINAGGINLTVRGNALRGTFNSVGPYYLTGVIGSVTSGAIIENNILECDQIFVDGIRINVNAENVTISGNQFNGTFLYGVHGVANNVIVDSNTLDGTASGFVLLDRPVGVASEAYYKVSGNVVNGLTSFFSKGGSGHVGEVSDNEIYMLEGYNGATTSVIEFGGSYTGVPASTRVIYVSGNTLSYTGTSPVSGSDRGIVGSSVVGALPANLTSDIQYNLFTTSIWGYAVSGSWINELDWTINGNSSNQIYDPAATNSPIVAPVTEQSSEITVTETGELNPSLSPSGEGSGLGEGGESSRSESSKVLKVDHPSRADHRVEKELSGGRKFESDEVVKRHGKRSKSGNKMVRTHAVQGNEVFPVNPKGGKIEGLSAYMRIQELTARRPDRVSLYVPPAFGLNLIDEIAAIGWDELFQNPGGDHK